MTDEARAARNAYKRSWYAANKDKAKATAERHWQKVADQKRDQAGERYFYPEAFAAEFERRSAARCRDLGVNKLTPEQKRELVLQIFETGIERPAVEDE